MEEILNYFFKDRAKLFLNYIHKNYRNGENGGKKKIIKSIKNKR